MIFLEHHKIKFSLVNAIHNFKKQQIEKLIKNNTFLGAISGHRKYINCLEFLTTSLYLPSLFFSRTIGTYALTLNIVAILGAETWAAKSWKGNQDDIDKLYHELYESDLLKGTLEDYDKQLPYLGVHEFKSSVRNMFWYSLNKTSDCLKHIRESVNEYNKPAY